MLQVFESHAECLSPYLFTLYAFPHLEEIAVKVKQRLGHDAVPMVINNPKPIYTIAIQQNTLLLTYFQWSKFLFNDFLCCITIILTSKPAWC